MCLRLWTPYLYRREGAEDWRRRGHPAKDHEERSSSKEAGRAIARQRNALWNRVLVCATGCMPTWTHQTLLDVQRRASVRAGRRRSRARARAQDRGRAPGLVVGGLRRRISSWPPASYVSAGGRWLLSKATWRPSWAQESPLASAMSTWWAGLAPEIGPWAPLCILSTADFVRVRSPLLIHRIDEKFLKIC